MWLRVCHEDEVTTVPNSAQSVPGTTYRLLHFPLDPDGLLCSMARSQTACKSLMSVAGSLPSGPQMTSQVCTLQTHIRSGGRRSAGSAHGEAAREGHSCRAFRQGVRASGTLCTIMDSNSAASRTQEHVLEQRCAAQVVLPTMYITVTCNASCPLQAASRMWAPTLSQRPLSARTGDTGSPCAVKHGPRGRPSKHDMLGRVSSAQSKSSNV